MELGFGLYVFRAGNASGQTDTLPLLDFTVAYRLQRVGAKTVGSEILVHGAREYNRLTQGLTAMNRGLKRRET